MERDFKSVKTLLMIFRLRFLNSLDGLTIQKTTFLALKYCLRNL